MPIIANNMVVSGNKVESEPVEKKTVKVQPIQPPMSEVPLKPLEEVSMVPKMHYDKAKHGIVIVDGKQKKISKQSQYILDMLTIDED